MKPQLPPTAATRSASLSPTVACELRGLVGVDADVGARCDHAREHVLLFLIEFVERTAEQILGEPLEVGRLGHRASASAISLRVLSTP